MAHTIIPFPVLPANDNDTQPPVPPVDAKQKLLRMAEDSLQEYVAEHGQDGSLGYFVLSRLVEKYKQPSLHHDGVTYAQVAGRA